jgi:DHA1 family 2-module integral membrane pump EmrD-like MFS transporter
MKRHKNFNLLLMLVLLVAVGQMAQTIYIPAIADMAIANAAKGPCRA